MSECDVCGGSIDTVLAESGEDSHPGCWAEGAYQPLDSMALRRYITSKLGPASWPLSTEETS